MFMSPLGRGKGITMAQPRFQLIPGSRLPGGKGGVGWRLLGMNNRELGRSAHSFPDAEAAQSAIARLRADLDQSSGHIGHDPASQSWQWRLDGSDGPVAVSGRGFRHERECRYNLEQFLVAAPVAPAAKQEVPSEFPWQRTELATADSEGLM
jgi:hypothetical protein